MTRDEIINTAYDIAEHYILQGLKLTIRQLYYQFVARGFLGSGQRVYQRIVNALTVARLNGRFPIDWIEDRGRTVGQTDTEQSDDLDDALANSAADIGVHPRHYLRYGMWYGQPEKVFVWIEKEALAGVLHDTCRNLGVGLFPCKGYPSVSAVSGWVTSTWEAVAEDESHVVVVYLGDHDPDGLQIPRSAEETIYKIQHVKREHFSCEIKVVALTMDQIARYNPPPFGAKVTSSRYQRYVDETGTTDAWELDALDPPVLQQLVRDSVLAHYNHDIAKRNRENISLVRTRMRDCMLEHGWLERALE
jgi:hypothetical protein